MRVGFVVAIGASVLIASVSGACGSNDNSFGDDGGPGLGGSSSGGRGSSSGPAPMCPTSCTTNTECQSACGAAAVGSLYCCDTTNTPGLCYMAASGSCTLTSSDAAPPRDAAMADATAVDATVATCNGTASCGAGQLCCINAGAGRGGVPTCQRVCTGAQVCAGTMDCTAPQVCTGGGFGGIRTCQNAPPEAAAPDVAPRDAAREAALVDSPTSDGPATDAPADGMAPDGGLPATDGGGSDTAAASDAGSNG